MNYDGWTASSLSKCNSREELMATYGTGLWCIGIKSLLQHDTSSSPAMRERAPQLSPRTWLSGPKLGHRQEALAKASQ
eukprot:1986311-Amphidinium_carterae.1